MAGSVRIMVAYHRRDVLFKDDVLTPIRLGAAVNRFSDEDEQWFTENTLSDDTGDNIS